MTPDPRFTLANERTLLAWVRTALGLVAGGAGVGAFAHGAMSDPLRISLALVLLGLGAAVTVAGYLRWRSVERAIEDGVRVPPSGLVLVLVVGVLLVCTCALVAVLSAGG